MSSYGLEIRDADGRIILDPSTFTVRQVDRRFISRSDLIAKVGKASWTRAVDFPWAECKAGMFVSVSQTGFGTLPRSATQAELDAVDKETTESAWKYQEDRSLTAWLNGRPLLPVPEAHNGFVRLRPAVHSFHADVWLSLYVVV